VWHGADQFVSNDPKSTHFAPNGIRIVDFRHVYQVPVGTQIVERSLLNDEYPLRRTKALSSPFG
jgi:hypothetical protein